MSKHMRRSADMAEYRYYLIPDAMTRAFPEQFGKQTPTEFFDNIADLKKRYLQLREMPYNNERTWNERARFPYERLVVGVDRQNPDGAVAVIQVRNGINYLCDDYRGPYADGSDAQITQMAKKLVEVIGVDRVRPHTYTQRDGYTWVQVEKDMHITEWLYAHELCSSLQFTRFLNRDGRELFQVRDGQRVIETNADGTKRIRAVKNIDVTHDGIWTMDGDGEVRLTIMASIAQDESRKTSERVKAGQKMSREKGVLYGSGNIIGYDRVDGTYVINEEQAATVRRIFNLYAEGHGETTVAKMLIEENRKDGGGGLSWTASKVSRVLRKPTYKGYMTYNKSHIDDFLSHNRINHSEEDFVLVKGNFEPIVSEALWETCNQIRSKRAAFVKGKDGRAHKFGVSFPQNKWTKILFCDCGMRFQIEGYDKTANGGKNMRLICARSKMFKKKDAARALNGIPCPAPYASEWKLELMAREVFRTVWKENAEDILGLLRMLDANLNTTGTPNDGNQLENKLSALNEELDDLVSQRASRSITMDDFLSRSTEINNEIINVEGLLQSSIQEQRPKARLDMHSIEAALSDDASFPDGKIEPGFLDRYANRIVKSNNRYIWMLQLVNVQQIMPIQSERQPIAMVTYKSGVPYDIEQEQTGKQDKESAGPDCATICRPQDFFLNMSRTKRKRKLVEWLESCQENQVNVLDEKIPLLSFAVDFVTAYEYQKARGIKIHPGLWKDMRVDIFLVKKEN